MNSPTATNDTAQYPVVGKLDHPTSDGRLAFAVYECPLCLTLVRRPDAHLEHCENRVSPASGI